MKTTLTQQEANDYLSKAQAAGYSPEVARQHLQQRGITIESGNPVGNYAMGMAKGGLDLVKHLAAPPIKMAGALALKGFQGVDALSSYAAGKSPTPLTSAQEQTVGQITQEGLSPRNIRDSLLTLSPFGGAKFAKLALPAAASEFALAKSEGKPTGEAITDAAKIGVSTRLLGAAGGPKTMAAIGGGLQAANEYASGENPISPEGIGGIAAAAGLGFLGGKANEKGYDVGMSKPSPNEQGATKSTIGSEAKSLVSQFSGLRSSSQEAAFDPQTRSLTEGMLKGTTEPMSAVNKVHETLSKLAEDVSDTGKEYNFVRNSTQVEPVPKDIFQKTLNKYGMRFVPEGKSITSPVLGNQIQNGHLEIDPTGPAARMSPHAIDQLEAFMKMAGGTTAITPEVFKQAKSALREAGDFYDPSIPGGGGAIKGLAGEMLSTLDGVRNNATTPDFKSYKALDEKYAPKIRQLNELRGFFEPDPATGQMRIKDTARGKILNALKGNKTNLISDLERLSPGITRQIRAYETYQNIIEENKPGQYARAIAKGAGAGYVAGGTLGGVAGGIAAIFASEPAVVFSLLSKIAKTKESLGIKPDQVMFKIERGMPLNDAETAAIKEAARASSTQAKSKIGSKGEASSPTLPEQSNSVNTPSQ